MNKTTATLSVLLVAGAGLVTYSLWHGNTGPVTEPTAAVQPSAARPAPANAPQGAPVAARTAQATHAVEAQSSDGDEHGQFGHASGDRSPTTLSTSPEPPAVEVEDPQDGKSLAPALVALNGNLATLLKDAGPDVAEQVAALPGARAAIERLLTDPDPAVRDQASAVLKTLSPQR